MTILCPFVDFSWCSLHHRQTLFTWQWE